MKCGQWREGKYYYLRGTLHKKEEHKTSKQIKRLW
jgi:hypothetical protein